MSARIIRARSIESATTSVIDMSRSIGARAGSVARDGYRAQVESIIEAPSQGGRIKSWTECLPIFTAPQDSGSKDGQ